MSSRSINGKMLISVSSPQPPRMPKRKKAAKAAPAGMAVSRIFYIIVVTLMSRVDRITVQQPNSYQELQSQVHHQELLLPLLCPLAALPLHAQYPNPPWEVEQAEPLHHLLLLLRPHLLLLDRLSRCTKPSMLSQVRKEKSLWSRVNWLK